MEAPGAGDAAAAAAAAASEGKKAKKQKKKDKKEKQKAKKKAKKDKKKAKKLKKKEKRLQRKLKKLERNKLSSSSSSSSSTSSSSSSSSGPPSPPREKMRRRDEAAPLGGDAALPAFRSSRPPVEKSRESLSLKLLGEIYAAKQGAAKGPRWRYPLRDESRRCFAGLLSPEIPDETLNRFRERIARTTTWGQPVSPKTGEPIPRKTAWMVAGKCKCTYKYGGVEVEPVEFPRWMSELMEACMPFCGLPSKEHWPNCCNLNLYDDGGMSVGWHADDEQLFQGRMKDCPIISLSLGAARTFELKPNDPEEGEPECCRIRLASGDLLTMEGLTQKHYQHRVPREKAQGPRINLTWRWIRKHTARCPILN